MAVETVSLSVCMERIPDLPPAYQQLSLPGGCYVAWRRFPFPPRLDGYLHTLLSDPLPHTPLPDYQHPPYDLSHS